MPARLHRAGELTPVCVPDVDHEAMRDLTRLRSAVRYMVTRARQHLLSTSKDFFCVTVASTAVGRHGAWMTRQILRMTISAPRTPSPRLTAYSRGHVNRAIAPALPGERGLVYDADWDEVARLDKWRARVEETRALPPLMAAALVFDPWAEIEPLQRQNWLGPLLVAAFLRARGKTRHHLAALHSA